jgi:hypothetical protein
VAFHHNLLAAWLQYAAAAAASLGQQHAWGLCWIEVRGQLSNNDGESTGEKTGLMAQKKKAGEKNVGIAPAGKFSTRKELLKGEVEPLRQSLFCSSR